MIRLAKRLSDPRKLRKHYLKTNFTRVDPPMLRAPAKSPRNSPRYSPRFPLNSLHHHHHQSSSSMTGGDSFGELSSIFETAISNSANQNNNLILNHHLELSSPPSPVPSSSSSSSSSSFFFQPSDHSIKIKLVISDAFNWTVSRKLRQYMSPLIHQSSQYSQEYGLFHSAVLVGPWKLEWLSSGLCIPRRCTSEKAILTVDVGEIEGSDRIVNFAHEISEFIAEMNGSYSYSQAHRSENRINCQHFVDLFFERFQLQPKHGASLERYLDRLRRKGSTGMVFEYDEEFASRFHLSSSKIKFKSHVQLDSFVVQLLASDPFLSENWPNEYELLKSFDRAMWMRMYSEERHKAEQQHQETEESQGAEAQSNNHESSSTTPRNKKRSQSQQSAAKRRSKSSLVHQPLSRSNSTSTASFHCAHRSMDSSMINDVASSSSSTSEGDEHYAPDYFWVDEDGVSCPFKNPKLTGSYTLHYQYFDHPE